MKTPVISLLLLLVVIATHAQTNYDTFKQLQEKNDTTAMIQLLQQWEKQTPDDPELYTSKFNYYFMQARQSRITLGDNPKGESFQLSDSATEKPAGYIYNSVSYNPKYLDPAFATIDAGIKKFPRRLDIRFGKIYLLGEVEDFDAFTNTLAETIEYGAKNSHNWLWTLNKPLNEDPKEYLLSNAQSYVNGLYRQGDTQAKNIRRIAETVLKYYPDHSISLSNLAVSYFFENRFADALETLLKAEKLAPADYIILGNIAHAYRNLNKPDQAKVYYKKILEHGDTNAKAFAQRELDSLKP